MPGGVVSPKTVTITVGGFVQFVNSNTLFHWIQSDPHPIHTLCPEINSVGELTPVGTSGSQGRTGVFTAPRTCTYHDHNYPTNTTLQGTIIIR